MSKQLTDEEYYAKLVKYERKLAETRVYIEYFQKLRGVNKKSIETMLDIWTASYEETLQKIDKLNQRQK